MDGNTDVQTQSRGRSYLSSFVQEPLTWPFTQGVKMGTDTQEGENNFWSLKAGQLSDHSPEFKSQLYHLVEGKLPYPYQHPSSHPNGDDNEPHFIGLPWKLYVVTHARHQT